MTDIFEPTVACGLCGKQYPKHKRCYCFRREYTNYDDLQPLIDAEDDTHDRNKNSDKN